MDGSALSSGTARVTTVWAGSSRNYSAAASGRRGHGAENWHGVDSDSPPPGGSTTGWLTGSTATGCSSGSTCCRPSSFSPVVSLTQFRYRVNAATPPTPVWS